MSEPNIKNAFSLTEGFFVTNGMPPIAIFRYLYNKLSDFGKGVKYLGSWNEDGAEIAFHPDFKLYRQEIIKRLTGIEFSISPEAKLMKVFENVRLKFPLKRDMEGLDLEHLTELTERVEKLYGGVNTYLKARNLFREDPTYQYLKGYNRNFHTRFGRSLEAFDKIQDINQFYIDLERPKIVPASIPPKLKSIKLSLQKDTLDTLVGVPVRNELRQIVTKLHEEIIENFRSDLWSGLREALYKTPNQGDNFVTIFNSLAMPVFLYRAYNSFIKKQTAFPIFFKEEGFDLEFNHTHSFPVFADHFDLKNLFPYELLSKNISEWDDYVPIDFKTNPRENKFLFVGMNSAGKSFFLKNMFIAAHLSSIGLPILSDTAIFPDFRRLFYLNNTDTAGFGKMESEMKAINSIYKEASRDDLVVIDNYFEGGTPQVTAHLAPRFLEEKLTKLEATIFIESHAQLDLEHFKELGWIIYSPNYKIEDGKIKPTFKLSRGIPDMNIVSEYAKQLAGKYF